MALILLKSKAYLKIDINNNYEIYPSKSARLKFKKATPAKKIVAKYIEKLEELSIKNDPEKYYYLPEEAYSEYDAWLNELEQFKKDYGSFTTGNKYPLIAQFFPKAELSIPPVIASGYIDLEGTTVAEKYEEIKKFNIFGPADMVEDA